MAGNKIGSQKAIVTIKEKYGADFFKNIGQQGGRSIKNVDPITGKARKGFAISGLAVEAGRKGGLKKRPTVTE